MYFMAFIDGASGKQAMATLSGILSGCPMVTHHYDDDDAS